MNKFIFNLLSVTLVLASIVFAENSNRTVGPQIFAPAPSSTESPNKEPLKETPRKEVRPAGQKMHGNPPGHKPPPPGYHHYYYEYYDPFYAPRTTVVVYEGRDRDPVYVEASVPDTIRIENPFPVTYSLGIVGLFGPYFMTSDYSGYDFSGYYGGGGLTVQIPINSTSLAFVTGVLYTYSKSSNTFDYYEDFKPTGESAKYTFTHQNVVLPIYVRLRAPTSRFSFDFGGKVLLNFRDRLEIKDDSGKHWFDLDDDKNVLNFALSLGFNIDLNRYITFNLVSDFAFGEMYNTSKIEGIYSKYTESMFSLGFTFNIF